MANVQANRLSRDDFRKAKELEELRKTGSAPPELDEDGKMINPHIPQYISQAPWYLNVNRPGLKHQRMSHFGKDGSGFARLDQHYERGATAGRAKAYRKGACENCGAMTHKTKDCCERPRRKGAKLTGSDIAPDEVIQELQWDFEGKRDRWKGYDPTTYKKQVIEIHEKAEEARRQKKAQELDAKYRGEEAEKKQRKEERKKRREERKDKKKKYEEAGMEDESDTESDTDTDTDDDSEDEEKGDKGEILEGKRDARTRTTVRNLRLREDRAKYLYNLDTNSAYYDPKTRSMRENPHPDKNPEDLVYAGDNFVRSTGLVTDVGSLTTFVHQANEKGEDINLVANPSAVQAMYAQFKEKKEQLKQSKKNEMLSKYGGKEHLEAPPSELLLAQSENYVEYSEDGRIIKGQEKAVPKTKYIEDVCENNHTEIWGSYYQEGKWGYACCNQIIRGAWCTGETGKRASQASQALLQGGTEDAQDNATGTGATKRKAEEDGPTSTEQSARKRPRAEETSSASVPPAIATPDRKFGRKAVKGSGSGSDSDGDNNSERAKLRRQRRAKLQQRRSKKEGESSSSSDSSSSGSSSSSSDSDSDAKKKEKSKKSKSKKDKGKGQLDGYDGGAQEEKELDAYMRKKQHAEDPMARLDDTEELLPIDTKAQD